MNVETLRGLSRPELQKLARANKVKANLKSETIIALLVERHLQDVPHASRKSESRKSDVPKPNLRSQRNPRRSLSHDTQTTFGTPESSPEHTPEPILPENFDYALEIMSTISSGDAELLPQIQELHSLATLARRQAADLRTVLRAERGLRERLDAYARYWREIAPGWSDRELWGDRMRVRFGPGNQWEELSSDEESEPEDTTVPDGALATLKPGQDVPTEYLEAGPASHGEVNMNGKRSREPDDDHSGGGGARYKARMRSEVNGAGGRADKPTSSEVLVRKPLDKGKGKMTAGEVEQMILEGQLHRQSRAEATDHELAVTLSDEDMERARVVALLSEADHRDDKSVDPETPRQLPTPEVERRTTRKSSRQPQTRPKAR